MKLSDEIEDQVKELVDTAYRRELNRELGTLSGKFTSWDIGDLDGVELAEMLKNFAEEAMVSIDERYETKTPTESAAYGIVNGLIWEDEFTPEISRALETEISKLK